VSIVVADPGSDVPPLLLTWVEACIVGTIALEEEQAYHNEMGGTMKREEMAERHRLQLGPLPLLAFA
jgi:hypothetical protein